MEQSLNILGYDPNVAYDAVFTVGTPAATCAISVQLNGYDGKPIKEAACVTMYASDDSSGDDIVALGTSGIVAGTDGSVLEVVADTLYKVISEADGDIDVTLDGSGANTRYLVVVLPSGRICISDSFLFTS